MPKKVRSLVLGLFLALVGVISAALVVGKAHAEEEEEWEWGDPYPPVSGIGWDISEEGVLTVESDAGWQDYLAKGPGEWIYEYDSITERVQKLVIGKNVTMLSIFDTKRMNEATLMETDYMLIGHAGPYQKVVSIALQNPKSMPPKIEVEEGNPVFVVIDGLLINKKKQSVVLSEINVSNVVIPDGIKSIEAWAFYQRKLKSVTFPNTLESIGAAAFSQCIALTRVVLPDSVVKVEACAFSGCSLQSITLSKNLKTIEGFAFSSCEIQEVKIPAGVSSVGFKAFQSCKSLKRVQLPEGLTKIDNYAFGDCSVLEEINLPDSLTYIGYRAFEDCTKWRIIQLPNTLNRIGGEVFYGCNPILLQLPNQLVIENTPPEKQGWCTTFEEPESTQTLGISYVETLIVSGSRYKFGEYAAKTADQIVFLTNPPANIHSFVTKVHSGNVSFLDKFASNWDQVDEDAWGDLTLQQVSQNQVEEMIRASIDLSKTGHVPREPAEEQTSDEETYQVFEHDGWSYATNGTLTLRSNEGWIDALQQDGLGHGGILVIGKKITELPFYDLTEPVPIEGFQNPTDVQDDDESLFAKDKSMSGYLWPWKIYLEPGNTAFIYGDGMLVDMRTMEIVMSDSALPEHVVIPEGIRSIGNGAFIGRIIKSVQLPSTLEKVGADAFRDCSYLTSIDIPNSVTTIGKRAFWECTSLKTIHFPRELKVIKEGTFRECGLVDVVLPDDVCELGEEAFFRCEELQNVRLSASLKKIGPVAFSDCGKLKHVWFSDKLESIGVGAFSWCIQLKDVVLPDSVHEIGVHAFLNCELSLLRLPPALQMYDYDWDNQQFLPDVELEKGMTLGLDSVGAVIFAGSDYDFGYPAITDAKNVYFLSTPPEEVGQILDKDSVGNIYCSDEFEHQWTRSSVASWVRQKLTILPAAEINALVEEAVNATPEPIVTPRPTPTPLPTETPWPTPIITPVATPKEEAPAENKPIDPLLFVFAGVIAVVIAGIVVVSAKTKGSGHKQHRQKTRKLR